MKQHKRIHVIVSGRVQGVFFRAKTQERALHLGLKGWVKNRPEGTVEIAAEGFEEGLESLIEWAHHGPKMASVTNVDAEWLEFKNEFRDFSIK